MYDQQYEVYTHWPQQRIGHEGLLRIHRIRHVWLFKCDQGVLRKRRYELYRFGQEWNSQNEQLYSFTRRNG